MSAVLVAVLADLPKPTRPPGEVSRTIDRVLARPEYRHPGPSFLERIQRGEGHSQITLKAERGYDVPIASIKPIAPVAALGAPGKPPKQD